MPFHEAPEPHYCELPEKHSRGNATYAHNGALFACDECQRTWIAKGETEDRFATWEPISKRRYRRRLRKLNAAAGGSVTATEEGK
jgi:hypothetical protein